MKPTISRKAPIPTGAVFRYGGRMLMVVKAHGTDKAAPVIVEELTGEPGRKGQLGLWGYDGVARALRKPV